MKIPIVDESDNLLYYKELKERDMRKEVSRGASLWLINEKGEVLIAKRSKNKPNFPNLWGLSVSGGVEKDESYEATIIREAKEEIGVDLEKVKMGLKARMSDDNEFFSQYFWTKISSDTKFILQESEVDEVRWISLSELKDWYFKNPEEFTPNFDICLKAVANYNDN